MALIKQGAIRGTHRAAFGLAAYAGPIAHLDGLAEPVLRLVSEKGLDRGNLNRCLQWLDPQRLRHRRRLDNVARVHAILRIKDRLDRPKAVADGVAVETPQKMRTSPAVTVLAGKRPPERLDQIGHFRRDCFHRQPIGLITQTDHGANVQTPD